jgi:small-conductance mechanosensitive channel
VGGRIMKLNLSYTEKEIQDLIQRDLENKLGITVKKEDIEIFVQSKQNYRVHEWERGLLKCDLSVDI